MTLEISTDRGRLDVAMIHAFLADDSYWVPGISRASYVRYAHLLDVFVLPEFRGRGIAKLLMENILSHPELQTIVRYTLGTQDAHGLYAQYGFTAFANPERQMELLRAKTAPQAPAPHNAEGVVRLDPRIEGDPT